MEELGSVSRFIGEADHAFLSEASFNYAPRRSWSTGGEAMIFWGKGDLNDAWAAQVIQRADYSLFSSYGTRRKLMALQQQAIYERLFGAGVDDTYEKNPWYAGFQVAATFYPYRFLTLGTRVEYRYYGLDGAGIINYGADVSIPFEKMTITLAYEYGQADDTWIENPGLKEQRWEVDIKKTF